MNHDQRHASSLLPVLRPLLRQLNLAVWLESSLPAFGLLAGIWASGILLLKAIGVPWLDWAYASGVLLGLAPAYGYWQSRRRGLFFAPRHGAEWADHLFRNDGQISAFFELPTLYPSLDAAALNREVERVLRERGPRLRPAFFVKRLVPVCAYVAAALWMPARSALEAGTVDQQAMRTLTEPLVERLEEHRDRLPDERVNELLTDLQRLQESPAGLTRESWEAIEHLEQQMQDVLDQSRQAAMNVAEALQDLTRGPGFRDNPLAAASNPQVNLAVQELKDAINRSSQNLPPEIMKQLAAATAHLDKLCQGGAELAGVDRETLMQCIGQLQGELDQLLKELDDELESRCAGRGGIDRGRADAPMILGDAQPLDNARFDEDRLRNRFLSPEDLVDVGITLLQPQPDPGPFSPGTLRSFDGERGQAVSRTRISPGQREVVERYFSDQSDDRP